MIDDMFYILDGRKVVPVSDPLEWSIWREDNRRKKRVAKSTLVDGTWISTVFVGMKTFADNLFETIVFNNQYDLAAQEVFHYQTWEEAEACHKDIVSLYLTKQPSWYHWRFYLLLFSKYIPIRIRVLGKIIKYFSRQIKKRLRRTRNRTQTLFVNSTKINFAKIKKLFNSILKKQ